MAHRTVLMSYHEDLQECYSQQARQFDHSRKRKRPEVEQLLADMDLWDSPTIVDLGCWSGRLYPILKEHFGEQAFSYIWVDSARGMIQYAYEQYPHAQRVCASMQDYISSIDQESIDCIICLASMQHLQSSKTHLSFLKDCYRGLSYNGQAFLINRSWSEWFVNKYRKEILKAAGKSLISKFSWNDVFIPWKDPQWRKNKKIYRRMYHVFGLWEITRLCKQAFFNTKKSGYILQSGKLWEEWKLARNTYIVCKK